MIRFDKDGYTNDPETIRLAIIENMIAYVRGMGYPDQWNGKNIVEHFTGIMDRVEFPETFYEFACNLSNADGLNFYRATNIADFSAGKLDTSMTLLKYHYYRFAKSGKVMYKIRPKMVERLNNIEISFPGKLLVAPHKEFVISMPFGIINTNLGSLVSIYVSSEPFTAKGYLDDKTITSDRGVMDIVREHGDNINRTLRAIGVFYDNKNAQSGQTAYYQLPIVEDMDVQKQFSEMISKVSFENKESVNVIFNMVLNFCAYLSTKDPDIQKVLGIKYTSSSNPKKQRLAEMNNRLYGYDYVDVGRIYDTRYVSTSSGSGRQILKRFLVRAHIRAQWYGPKTDGPGTEQRLILIEEFEKGSDLNTELQSKQTLVGDG